MSVLAKIRRHPRLEGWEFRLAEVHLANHADLLRREPGRDRLPVIGGKAIASFEVQREHVQYYVDEDAARKRLWSHVSDSGHEHYRLAFRDIASNTSLRTVVATIIPPRCLCARSVAVERTPPEHATPARLYLLALLNSFIVDYALRAQMSSSAHILPSVRRLHIPDLRRSRPRATDPIVGRAADLISTSPEYDSFAGSLRRQPSSLSTSARARIRAELDGLLAHAVGLTEDEFLSVLRSFPLVPEPARVAAHNAYRDVERGLLQ